MHVLFIEPAFPANQREFVRGLHETGARVTGIGERPAEYLDRAKLIQALRRIGREMPSAGIIRIGVGVLQDFGHKPLG